ncbi:MAG: beta-propeller fold lactonase family protein, partial [Candidatus Korobacteraceae bacterium]
MRMLLRCFLASLLLFLAACNSGSAPSEPKTEPSGYRIYVTNETSGDMSVIDSTTHEVVSTVPLGKRPRGIHPSPDGHRIYVALSGSPPAPPGVDEDSLPPPDRSADGIGVVDIHQLKLDRLVRSGTDPEEFGVSNDGKLVFVSNEDAGEVSIVDINAGKVVSALPVGEEPEGVTVSPDGKHVYVTSENTGTVAVIDAEAHKLLKTIKVGRRPRSVAFLRDSSRAYVTNENDGTVTVPDAVKQEVISTIKLGEQGVIRPMSAVVSADGSKLYVSTGRGKMVFTV